MSEEHDIIRGTGGGAAGKKKEKKSGFFLSLFGALFIAVAFRSLAFEPFYIPSGSMKPTLLVGDYVFVSKYTYGYSKFSFPLSPDIIEGRKFGRLPGRGEIAVFKHPKDPKTNYIKRIVGLPGDTLQMIKGTLYINGDAVPRVMQPPFEDISSDNFSTLAPVYRETLPGGAVYDTLDKQRRGVLDSTGVYTVPENHYFVMGDNRDNSVDSRVTDEVGFVPLENMVGPARMILFSSEGSFFNIVNWIRKFRGERAFRSLTPGNIPAEDGGEDGAADAAAGA